MWVARIFQPVTLQRAQVVGVAEFIANLLEELPVAFRVLGTYCSFQMLAEIRGDLVVKQQRVIDVKQEDDFFIGHGISLKNKKRRLWLVGQDGILRRLCKPPTTWLTCPTG